MFYLIAFQVRPRTVSIVTTDQTPKTLKHMFHVNLSKSGRKYVKQAATREWAESLANIARSIGYTVESITGE